MDNGIYIAAPGFAGSDNYSARLQCSEGKRDLVASTNKMPSASTANCHIFYISFCYVETSVINIVSFIR